MLNRAIPMSALALVLLVTGITGHSLLLRKQYRRPICAANESCLTSGFGIRFGICDCPGENPVCPESNPLSTVTHNEFNYHFCQPRDFSICKPGEIATTVRNFQMIVHCICPEGQQFIAQTISDGLPVTIDYVCGIRKTCEMDERCQINVFGTPQRRCDCPSGTYCVPVDTTDAPNAGYCA
uniref:EB domain-containing protein n=1 Tax=Steinernema glaseri TaxID=37863 RepID=A0A1I7Z8Y3_9BILA